MAKYATSIKEKTMTPKSGFLPASFSAALAIVLLTSASAARAEVVTLVCQNETNAPGSFRLRVNYDQKIVELLNSNGTTRFSAPARITESDVWWEAVVPNMEMKFEGGLNRLTGHGYTLIPTTPNSFRQEHMGGPCRRATQKF
jgi:hypothetical protein